MTETEQIEFIQFPAARRKSSSPTLAPVVGNICATLALASRADAARVEIVNATPKDSRCHFVFDGFRLSLQARRDLRNGQAFFHHAARQCYGRCLAALFHRPTSFHFHKVTVTLR
jgi:hypothetical protein